MSKSYANRVSPKLLTWLLMAIFSYASTMTTGYAQEESATEEIVVTATKREESIQSIGLSVSALQGEELQAQGAVDFEDYAVSIPNLSFGATDDGILASRSISIRGIQGLNTTGFYIDDVPLDESVDPLVLDVERVEVLRGPQGTLFGARGLGGTIRIITKQPEFDEFSSHLHTGLSDTREGGLNTLIDGAFNIPISDTFAARISAYYQGDKGIFDRVVGSSTAPGVVVAPGTAGAITGDSASVVENVDDKETYGAQLALRIEPTDDFSINGRLMYQKTTLDGFPLADFTGGGGNLSAEDFTQERLFNIAEGGEDEWYQISLNLNYDAAFGTFGSSSGYFNRETHEFEDSSEFVSFRLINGIFGQPAQAIPAPIFQLLEFDSFVQEFRFVSDFDGPFSTTLGAFYQRTDDDEAYTPDNNATGFGQVPLPLLILRDGLGNPILDANGNTIPDLVNLVMTSSDLIFRSDYNTEIKELGLFGEFSYALTDRLDVTLGARYFDTEVTNDDYADGFAAGGPSRVANKQSEDGFNLKGLIEYEVDDNIFLYTSIAEGFRIGGANGVLPESLGCRDEYENDLGFTDNDVQTYDSDSLLSYEIGAKTDWYDTGLGDLTLNAAAFYIDFDDIQQRILLPCGFPFITNLGSAKSSGIEVEMTARPSDNLNIRVGLGYTDAEFTEVVAGVVEKGDRLQQVPEFTLSSSIDYSAPFHAIGGYDWFARADFAFVDSSISTVVSSENPRTRPSYALLDARLGLKNDANQVTFFVDNVFDRDVVLSDSRSLAAEAGGRVRVARNRPRTIGIDFRINF